MIGQYDPDEEGPEAPVKRPAWMLPKDELDKKLLEACRCKYFKTAAMRKQWRSIRGHFLGANEESFLWEAWVKHNIEIARKENQRSLTRVVQWVLNRCEDLKTEGTNRKDWFAANRDRVLKERASSIGKFFRPEE